MTSATPSAASSAAPSLSKSTTVPKRKKSAFSDRKVDHAFYWMAVPAAIVFAVFLYWPFLRGIGYSFTNSKGFGDYKWIGFKNYGALFRDSRVGHAYLFTFLIAVLITMLINAIALFLSVALNGRIAFKNGFRAIYFVPYTLGVLVIGYVFKYIFMTPLPSLGKTLGISWLSQSLLTSEQYAWVPIVFLSVWQGVAYSVLIYLAGLQTIDEEIYEAAAIDGVNAWQKFWKITFPLIGPFFTINLVLSLKNAFNTFDQVVALTDGGPDSKTETVTYLIWKGGLTGGEYAYQTANAVLFFVVLAVIAFIQLRISNSQEKV
ncbi:sugar ABC transporter permease [Bifidobacterium sp. ESL0704]|uniref:carbohydrate ABC transporter permease n=1 Tax=Bifidobacterium sp. ESL0704 TaxID=2983219 RepID=UPI0023F7CC76|nr:sugar ABC transporter permease [Bifidobacterium sp. ESL0704]WEV53020.1 sugar ABC transporter permease [Bifidobacterium sp. ESL0704]